MYVARVVIMQKLNQTSETSGRSVYLKPLVIYNIPLIATKVTKLNLFIIRITLVFNQIFIFECCCLFTAKVFMLRSLVFTGRLLHRSMSLISATTLSSMPNSINTPLSSTQFEELLAAASSSVPQKKQSRIQSPDLCDDVKSVPYLHRGIPVDVERTPLWVNNVEDHILLSNRNSPVNLRSKRIHEQTGFNYVTLFGVYGIVKLRVPFLTMYNPFTQELEISPHPSQYASEVCVVYLQLTLIFATCII